MAAVTQGANQEYRLKDLQFFGKIVIKWADVVISRCFTENDTKLF